jgi:DNA-directed RNA polymerase subunit H (RpoH/RPB5)
MKDLEKVKSEEPTPPKKILSSEEIRELLKKYQPGKVTALPPMMNHQAS